MQGSLVGGEPDEDGTHVVHTVEVAAVFTDQLLQQFLDDGLVRLLLQAPLHPLYHLLVRLDLPNTIATHYNELYSLVFEARHVRIGRYRLLFWLHIGGPFIL